jgi:hypothetical protein
VPFVYALPPIDVSSSLGMRGTGPVAPQVDLNIGVRPLALFPSMHHRENDFALGYSLVFLPNPFLHGPYGEFNHVFLTLETSDTGLWRLRGGPVVRLLYDPTTQRFGSHVLGRAVFEFSSLVDDDFESSNDRATTVGHALGELGIGVYAEGGVMITSTLGWTASVGLIVTIPASAGVGLAWIW